MFTGNAEGLKEFEIKRSGWIRGKDSYSEDSNTTLSMLLTPSGQRCCLGFYANAAGIDDIDILNIGSPETTGVEEKFAEVADCRWLLDEDAFFNSKDCDRLMEINDANPYYQKRAITEEEREELIIEIFRAHGYLPVFVD